ncbi:mesaconyl-C4 CoA hydratase [Fusarium austroafricanum]|uniref:Mesaconyl-C4 CoA hydratase n=1 Tax=Fusarium austroafricanum TaxID=2364996 RepID=A0A8H4KQ74_9HYPO|nr:mesaconyl-C4 CoA hydratase [Fusarium austroafricanum]
MSRLRNVKATASDAASRLLETFSDKTVIRRQLLDANQLQKLSLTLNRLDLDGQDVSDQAPVEGTPVPPGYHLAYFTPNGTETELGADGSDTTFNVSAPFTRRMWAGGQMTWTSDVSLRVGDQVEEKTKLISATPKKSRSAMDMVLVEVEKEFWGSKGLALTDRRSWIFRPEIDLRPLNVAPIPLDDVVPGPTSIRDLVGRKSQVGLFRFSALAFNGHMIHYNQNWTQNVEGHPAEVVHGPLNLINILDYWRDIHGSGQRLSGITYRALSPLYAGQTYNIRTSAFQEEEKQKTWEVLVEKGGTVCMKSEIMAEQPLPAKIGVMTGSQMPSQGPTFNYGGMVRGK